MHVCLEYCIKVFGEDEKIAQLREFVVNALGESSVNPEGDFHDLIVVGDDVKHVYLEDLKVFAKEMTEAVPDVDFKIAEELEKPEDSEIRKKYIIEYKDGELTYRETDWFGFFIPSDYESYNDFCFECPYSYRLIDSQYYSVAGASIVYILDGGNGKVTTTLPYLETEIL